MTVDEKYMHRCLGLAKLGAGYVSPNPMVGAVLVHENRIIGEGFHEKYGEAHAEVNCLDSVSHQDSELIEKSTLYVSLEPCTHYGKTPPCTDLILKYKIKNIVIGCRDINKDVPGKGMEILRKMGVVVTEGILEAASGELNKRFFTYHLLHRPYVILKWAQSANAKIGSPVKRVIISNELTQKLVHKWRHQEDAILVGTGTILADDPMLTNRLWPGKNPVRIFIDKHLKVPITNKILNDEAKTLIYNLHKNEERNNLHYIKLHDEDFTKQITESLFKKNIMSVIIEGGGRTLQSFIDNDLWDEARVISNEHLIIEDGIAAPQIRNFLLLKKENINGDTIIYYKNGAT
jgi:diaminohydroxyphosphoribosylaminopyrimidine deaminase/5-amino-6-(5-phosphoribosylamino)uracil reductase